MHRLIEEIEKSKRQIDKQLSAIRFNRDEVKDSLKSLTEALIDLLNTYFYDIDYLMSLQWWKEVIAIIKNEQKLTENTLITCLCQWIDNDSYDGIVEINEERKESMRYVSFMKLFNLSKNAAKNKASASIKKPKIQSITKKKKVDASFFEDIVANGKKGETYSKGNVKIRLLTDDEIEQRKVEAKAIREINRKEKKNQIVIKNNDERKSLLKEKIEANIKLKEKKQIARKKRVIKPVLTNKERLLIPSSKMDKEVICSLIGELLADYSTVQEDCNKYIDDFNKLNKPYDVKTVLEILYLANKGIPASKLSVFFKGRISSWTIYEIVKNIKSYTFNPCLSDLMETGYFKKKRTLIKAPTSCVCHDYALAPKAPRERRTGNSAKYQTLQYVRENIYVPAIPLNLEYVGIICDELLADYSTLEEDYQKYIDEFKHTKAKVELKPLLKAIYLKNKGITETRIESGMKGVLNASSLQRIFENVTLPFTIEDLLNGYYKERIVNMDDARNYLGEYINGDLNSDVEFWTKKLEYHHCYLDIKTYLQVIYLMNKGVKKLIISRVLTNVFYSYVEDMERKLKNHKRPIDIQSLIDAGIIKPFGKNTIIDIQAKERKEIREKELSSIDEILSGYKNLDADIIKYDKILQNYVKPYKAELYLKTLYLLDNTSLSNQKIMTITKASKHIVSSLRKAVEVAKINNTHPMDEYLNSDYFKTRLKEVFYKNCRKARQANKQVKKKALAC